MSLIAAPSVCQSCGTWRRRTAAGVQLPAIAHLLRRARHVENSAGWNMKRLFLGLAFATTLVDIESAAAEVYPSRPITMVAPFPAGASVDTIGRIMAERMRQSLGQPVIIENVAGANGTIGVGRVARAAPDGYTIAI